MLHSCSPPGAPSHGQRDPFKKNISCYEGPRRLEQDSPHSCNPVAKGSLAREEALVLIALQTQTEERGSREEGRKGAKRLTEEPSEASTAFLMGKEGLNEAFARTLDPLGVTHPVGPSVPAQHKHSPFSSI